MSSCQEKKAGLTRGDRLKRYLFGLFVLAIGYIMTAGDGSSIADDQTGTKLRSMRFDWYTNGPAEQCSPNCHKWVSATGTITEDTVQDFQSFADKFDLKGATLVL